MKVNNSFPLLALARCLVFQYCSISKRKLNKVEENSPRQRNYRRKEKKKTYVEYIVLKDMMKDKEKHL